MSGAAAMLRSCDFSVSRFAASCGEALLLHLRLGRQRRDQAAHQLDVAVDVAFEPVADQADPAEHVGAQALLVHPPVLIFGKQPGNDDDEQRQRRRDVGRPQDQAQCVAKGVAPGCQVHQLAARPEVGPLQPERMSNCLSYALKMPELLGMQAPFAGIARFARVAGPARSILPGYLAQPVERLQRLLRRHLVRVERRKRLAERVGLCRLRLLAAHGGAEQRQIVDETVGPAGALAASPAGAARPWRAARRRREGRRGGPPGRRRSGRPRPWRPRAGTPRRPPIP